MRRSLHAVVLAMAACCLQAGCSVLSPDPLLELLKATGTAANGALALGPSSASNVIDHAHAPIFKVCIELNPRAQAAEVVQAMQDELQRHMVESRVYEAGTYPETCEIWLKYVARIEWDIPPLGDQYATYLTAATLTLRKSNGEVLSSSSYQLDPIFNSGKWSSTRRKLSPVITALLSGSKGN